MALIKPVPEAAVVQALGEGFEDFLDSDDLPRDLRKVPHDLHRTFEGQQVFELGLKDLVKKAPLRSAKRIGWRFLGKASGVGISSRVNTAPRTGQSSVESMSHSKGVAKAFQELQRLEKLSEVRAADYELRALSMPALALEAFWLKPSAADATDLLVPFHTVSPQLKVMRAYPAGEFFQILRPRAEKLRRFDDSARKRKPKSRSSR